MTPKRITMAWLREQGACKDEVARFRRAWPNGVRPNLATARRAARIGFDLGWVAKCLLPARAWAAYEEAVAAARAAYEEAIAPVWAAYEEAAAAALVRAYEEAVAAALVHAWRAALAAEKAPMAKQLLTDPPMDWLCDECGATSADAAKFVPATMDWMCGSDFDLLGPAEDVFTAWGMFYNEAADEVVVCGVCGHARWSAPAENGGSDAA